jgi:hypothetical protein
MAMIDLVEMIAGGEIGLDDLAGMFKDAVGGDLNWVIDHCNPNSSYNYATIN